MEENTEKDPFVEEQRSWLINHREQTGLSWGDLAKRTGIAQGTISQFGSPKGYNGRELPLAEKVERYRQALAQQAAIQAEVPDEPGFYETDTTRQLEHMLSFAQLGQMVAAALEAGCSKTMTAKHYHDVNPNVFYVEMRKSAGGPNNMLKMVLAALGVRDPSGGTFDMSRQVCDQLKKATKPLLIIDEAQHLNEASIEEIRSWNDAIDVGIALFGNVGVLQKLARFPQLYSRLSLKLQRRCPTHADIEAMADAWNITNAAVRAELIKICSKLGGLRSGTKTLQLAWMMAASEGKALGLDHVQDAWQQLDVRMVPQ